LPELALDTLGQRLIGLTPRRQTHLLDVGEHVLGHGELRADEVGVVGLRFAPRDLEEGVVGALPPRVRRRRSPREQHDGVGVLVGEPAVARGPVDGGDAVGEEPDTHPPLTVDDTRCQMVAMSGFPNTSIMW
jgi:hypothetical protein